LTYSQKYTAESDEKKPYCPERDNYPSVGEKYTSVTRMWTYFGVMTGCHDLSLCCIKALVASLADDLTLSKIPPLRCLAPGCSSDDVWFAEALADGDLDGIDSSRS